jgi:hypothetical protein
MNHFYYFHLLKSTHITIEHYNIELSISYMEYDTTREQRAVFRSEDEAGV